MPRHPLDALTGLVLLRTLTQPMPVVAPYVSHPMAPLVHLRVVRSLVFLALYGRVTLAAPLVLGVVVAPPVRRLFGLEGPCRNDKAPNPTKPDRPSWNAPPAASPGAPNTALDLPAAAGVLDERLQLPLARLLK